MWELADAMRWDLTATLLYRGDDVPRANDVDGVIFEGAAKLSVIAGLRSAAEAAGLPVEDLHWYPSQEGRVLSGGNLIADETIEQIVERALSDREEVAEREQWAAYLALEASDGRRT